MSILQYIKEELDSWNLPNKKWITISLKQLSDEMKDLLWKMYVDTYKNIGLSVQSKDELTDKYKLSWFIDIDNDIEPDAFIIYDETEFGNKIVLLGSDGNSLSKKLLILKMLKLLKTPGWYIEASHKVADIIKSSGIDYIKDEDSIRKILNKDIDMLEDGEYERTLGVGIKIKKRIYGNPIINEADQMKQYKIIEEQDLSPEKIQQGKDIADKLGIIFNGVWEVLNKFAFTDPETESSLAAVDYEDAKKTLINMRHKFATDKKEMNQYYSMI
jgi:hypothetical protein